MKRKYYTYYYYVTTFNSDYMFTDHGKLHPCTLPVPKGGLSTHFGSKTKRGALRVCRYIRTIDKECDIVVLQESWKRGHRYIDEFDFNG